MLLEEANQLYGWVVTTVRRGLKTHGMTDDRLTVGATVLAFAIRHLQKAGCTLKDVHAAVDQAWEEDTDGDARRSSSDTAAKPGRARAEKAAV